MGEHMSYGGGIFAGCSPVNAVPGESADSAACSESCEGVAAMQPKVELGRMLTVMP
ncbi:MAG: hypothetical protein V8Q42_09485 [Anaerovoracaceae bacterium]